MTCIPVAVARPALVAVMLGLCACAAAQRTASQPTPGPMPANAQWQGVYQGPYHITLSVHTQGNRARGTWRAIGNREGEFSGTVSGNLLVMDWSEHGLKNGDVTSGRGYFVYEAGKIRGPHQIYGEWGMGRGEASHPWWAVKRSNKPVDAKSARVIDDANDHDRDEADASEPCDLNCDTQDTEAE